MNDECNIFEDTDLPGPHDLTRAIGQGLLDQVLAQQLDREVIAVRRALEQQVTTTIGTPSLVRVNWPSLAGSLWDQTVSYRYTNGPTTITGTTASLTEGLSNS